LCSQSLFVRLMDMRLRVVLVLLFPWLILSCFSKTEQAPVKKSPARDKSVKSTDVSGKDDSLQELTRFFEAADSVHREAWWVLSDQRRAVGKTPFGKVQRALVSYQNGKLTNKSAFLCDRYIVRRDVLGLNSYPQQIEISEHCDQKRAARKIARIDVAKKGEVKVVFYPENLQEVLGLGAAILNKPINCTLNGSEQLAKLRCESWAQDRSQEQMLRFEVYEYQKEGKNLIKLRGKVYENLSDIRKFEAEVPMSGKITVTETELYAPPTPSPVPVAAPTKVPSKEQSEGNPAAAQSPRKGKVPVGPRRTDGAEQVDPNHLQSDENSLPPARGEPGMELHDLEDPQYSGNSDQGWPAEVNPADLPSEPEPGVYEDRAPEHQPIDIEPPPQPAAGGVYENGR